MARNSDGIGMATTFQPGSSEPNEQLIECEECERVVLPNDTRTAVSPRGRLWRYAYLVVLAALVFFYFYGRH